MKAKKLGLALLSAGLIFSAAFPTSVSAMPVSVLAEKETVDIRDFPEVLICNSDYVRMRETPRGKILGKVNRGTEVYSDGTTEAGWIHVYVPEVGDGYIYQSFLDKKEDASVEAPVNSDSEGFVSIGTRICCGDQVRVRETPRGRVLGKLAEGSAFEVDGLVDRGWVHVNVPDIGVGYVYQEYVQNIFDADKEDYRRYEGSWVSKDGICTLQLYCFFEQEAYFSWQIRGTDGSISVEAAGVYGTFQDKETLAFSYKDSQENEGEGTLTVIGDEIRLKAKTTRAAGAAKNAAACDMVLQKMDSGDEGFVFPDSDTRNLLKAEVERLSADQRRLARNEIFARHGRIFKSPDLAEYFESQRWYEGKIEPEIFDADTGKYLNRYEKANVKLILEVEAEQR